MVRTALPSHASSSLTLAWALGQLRKELGSGGAQLDVHAQRAGPLNTAQAGLRDTKELELVRSAERPSCSSMSSMQAPLGCVTPSMSDTSMQSTSSEQHRVHWAEALEQQATQRLHAPQHAHFAPDKPCLKAQQSSFPYLEEAAQLEGLLRRPRALIARVDGSGPPPPKKRSRLAAFAQ